MQLSRLLTKLWNRRALGNGAPEGGDLTGQAALIDTLSGEIGFLRESLVQLTEFPLTDAGERINQAQKEITSALSNPYYADTYRGEEVLYWLSIPDWILEWVDPARPGKLLDIGAGYGTLAIFAASTGAEVYCIDLYDFLLSDEIIKRHGFTFTKLNAEREPIPWSNLDGVIMTEVLEHFNFHPTPTMRKVYDAMAPGGRLFLSTPDVVSWGRVDGQYDTYQEMPPVGPDVATEDTHIYHFDAGEVTEVLEDAGFVVRRVARSPGRWNRHLNIEAEKPLAPIS